MCCLCLFSKDPEAGDAKSRLRDRYDKDFRRELAKSFLRDILLIADRLEGVDKVLNYSPPQSGDRMSQYLPRGWRLLPQQGEDLGQRMESFFQWAFACGYRQAVLIGSDFPTIPFQFLNQAFELLKTRSIVLGPSTDGGYYLIGLSKPHPELFHEIDWSSERVFMQTVNRLEGNLGLLPPWYDVDFPGDLTMLAGHLQGMLKSKVENIPEHTIGLLRRHRLL